MFKLFKKKKETFNAGEIRDFVPQILLKKEAHLEELLLLQQNITDKLDSSNTVYKKCRRFVLDAEQLLPVIKNDYNENVRNIVMSGGADTESFIAKKKNLSEKILETFTTIKYYDYVSTEINAIRTKLKIVFDPLQKHLRIMEEEVRESKTLLEKMTPKELEYFKSVSNIEHFSELEPAFEERVSSVQDIIYSCNDLCDFSTDQSLIDSLISDYKLEVSDKRGLEEMFS
tara:strand:- start:351 stop:1037 length:687 start_codon:yes stop_codon:yes gene_type:complete